MNSWKHYWDISCLYSDESEVPQIMEKPNNSHHQFFLILSDLLHFSTSHTTTTYGLIEIIFHTAVREVAYKILSMAHIFKYST